MKRRYRFGKDYYFRKMLLDIKRNVPKGTWPIVLKDEELIAWLKKIYLS